MYGNGKILLFMPWEKVDIKKYHSSQLALLWWEIHLLSCGSILTNPVARILGLCCGVLFVLFFSQGKIHRDTGLRTDPSNDWEGRTSGHPERVWRGCACQRLRALHWSVGQVCSGQKLLLFFRGLLFTAHWLNLQHWTGCYITLQSMSIFRGSFFIFEGSFLHFGRAPV